MLTLRLLFYTQGVVYSVAISLAFTSVCRQKHHIAQGGGGGWVGESMGGVKGGAEGG